jgi:Zn-dependent peptidase ImmA (M78 family)
MYILKKEQFIPDEILEKEAIQLLYEYERLQGIAITNPPIPIDQIAEFVLDVTVDHAEDLKDDSGNIVLGYANRNEQIIKINWGQLKRNIGRRNFTVAHEIGHLRLHFQLVSDDTPTNNLELSHRFRPLKQNKQKERFEMQANMFASALLMPKKLLQNHPEIKRDSHISLYALADDFHVSKQAMQIRLEKLNMFYIGSDRKAYSSKEASNGQKRLFGF